MFSEFLLFEVIHFPELRRNLLSLIDWQYLSLPINQAGFPDSQVAHNNDLGDFKSAEKTKQNKQQQVS